MNVSILELLELTQTPRIMTYLVSWPEKFRRNLRISTRNFRISHYQVSEMKLRIPTIIAEVQYHSESDNLFSVFRHCSSSLENSKICKRDSSVVKKSINVPKMDLV